MELTQLQQFRVLARVQHMTKAADELNVTQPSLSKTIRRLEDELGVALFDRPGRQIRLNQFGKMYLSYVNQVFFALEEGRQQVREMADLNRGEVALAADALHWLPDVLSDFKQDHPTTRFQLFQRAPTEIVRQLEQGEIDFGITASAPEGAGTEWKHLVTENVYLAVPLDHPLAGKGSVRFRDIANEPIVAGSRGCLLRDITDAACREAGFKPRVVCESDEVAAVRDFVKAGMGVAFIPALIRRQHGEQGLAWVPLTEPACQITFGITWYKAHHLSRAARTFREFILRYFAAELNPKR